MNQDGEWQGGGWHWELIARRLIGEISGATIWKDEEKARLFVELPEDIIILCRATQLLLEADADREATGLVM